MYGKGRLFCERFTDACWILLAFSRFDRLTWQAIAPSKANVQAVAIRGAGPADKITVQGLNRLDIAWIRGSQCSHWLLLRQSY